MKKIELEVIFQDENDIFSEIFSKFDGKFFLLEKILEKRKTEILGPKILKENFFCPKDLTILVITVGELFGLESFEKKNSEYILPERFVFPFSSIFYFKFSFFLGFTLLFNSLGQVCGLIPTKAYASPIPPTNVACSASTQEFTLSAKSESQQHSKSVVVAGLQPKRINRGLRKPIYLTNSALSRSTNHLVQTQKKTLTIFDLKYVQVSSRSHITTMAMLQRQEILVTKKHLIRNDTFLEKKNVFVQKQVEDLMSLLQRDSRISKLNKIINFQGWNMEGNVPVLIFNADGTYGIHSQNQKMCIVVKQVLDTFLQQNQSIFKGENSLSMQFRSADAEHPTQKRNLEGVLLTKNQAYSYLLPKGVHLEKTLGIDLTRPENIDNFPELFVFNGEKTINFLKTLWDQGKLDDSVECFEIYEKSIRECVLADGQAALEKGLHPKCLDFAGQINASTIGSHDCVRVTKQLCSFDKTQLDEVKCTNLLNKSLKKAQLRAAFIYDGLHLFPTDSHPYQAQDTHSDMFITDFARLINVAIKQVPALEGNKEFRQNFDDFLDALNGKGIYEETINSSEYATFKKALNDPAGYLHFIPKNCKVDKL